MHASQADSGMAALVQAQQAEITQLEAQNPVLCQQFEGLTMDEAAAQFANLETAAESEKNTVVRMKGWPSASAEKTGAARSVARNAYSPGAPSRSVGPPSPSRVAFAIKRREKRPEGGLRGPGQPWRL